MQPFRFFLGLFLSAGLASSLLGGCDTRRAGTPGAATPATTSPQAPAAGTAATPETGAPNAPGGPITDREQRYRQAVIREVVDNPEVGELIPRKPVLGGTWRVNTREDVQFLGNGRVALDYEDGHVAGRLIVRVNDPHDLSTWEVIRDEPA